MIELKSKIKNRESIIGIIGLGYVGLPLLIRFSEEKYRTIGFDVDINKVKMLNSGKSYIKHIKEKNILSALDEGFNATTDFSKISKVDIILICVPTPLNNNNEPDLSYINSTIDIIKPYEYVDNTWELKNLAQMGEITNYVVKTKTFFIKGIKI